MIRPLYSALIGCLHLQMESLHCSQITLEPLQEYLRDLENVDIQLLHNQFIVVEKKYFFNNCFSPINPRLGLSLLFIMIWTLLKLFTFCEAELLVLFDGSHRFSIRVAHINGFTSGEVDISRRFFCVTFLYMLLHVRAVSHDHPTVTALTRLILVHLHVIL